MLTLPYLLDGLADDELEAHNSACAVAARIADPIPETCMAINEWLHWYKLFRTPEPDDDDVSRLTDMGKALLSTLERVFSFKVCKFLSDLCGATKRCSRSCMPPA